LLISKSSFLSDFQITEAIIRQLVEEQELADSPIIKAKANSNRHVADARALAAVVRIKIEVNGDLSKRTKKITKRRKRKDDDDDEKRKRSHQSQALRPPPTIVNCLSRYEENEGASAISQSIAPSFLTSFSARKETVIMIRNAAYFDPIIHQFREEKDHSVTFRVPFVCKGNSYP
jgi:hypothetical protein